MRRGCAALSGGVAIERVARSPDLCSNGLVMPVQPTGFSAHLDSRKGKKMNHRSLRNRRAMTLVDVVTAMGICLVLTTMVYGGLFGSRETFQQVVRDLERHLYQEAA